MSALSSLRQVKQTRWDRRKWRSLLLRQAHARDKSPQQPTSRVATGGHWGHLLISRIVSCTLMTLPAGELDRSHHQSATIWPTYLPVSLFCVNLQCFHVCLHIGITVRVSPLGARLWACLPSVSKTQACSFLARVHEMKPIRGVRGNLSNELR